MGLFGSSFGHKFNKEADFSREMLQNEQGFTERMWNLTNDWNLQQWNRENAYNTPEALMQRFLDAGINPNDAAQAVAGHDSAAGSVQASAPGSPGTPGAPDPAGSDQFANFANLTNSIMGIAKYVDSERQKNVSEANNNDAAAAEHEAAAKKILESDIPYGQAGTENLKTDTELKKSLKVASDLLNTLTSIFGPAKEFTQLANMIRDGKLSDQQINKAAEEVLNLKKQREFVDELMKTLREERKQIPAMIEYYKSQAHAATTQAEKNQWESKVAAAVERGQNIDNLIKGLEKTLKKSQNDARELYYIITGTYPEWPNQEGFMGSGVSVHTVGPLVSDGLSGNGKVRRGKKGLQQQGRALLNAVGKVRGHYSTNNHKNP